ncbi:hypothetical protein E9529_18705 [Blastococcus sp. KM273128]|nr:hypothetical protein [Blastococcus sp. KM273128]
MGAKKCLWCGGDNSHRGKKARYCSFEHQQTHYHQLTTYNLTPDAFWRLQELRAGLCHNPGCTNGATETDHCHDTGAVRGRLCPGCNQGLGLFRHDPELLAGALAYLRASAAAG